MSRVAPKSRLECHRPFFALRPPPAARAAIAEVRDRIDGMTGAIPDDRLHMTLLMIDDLPILPDLIVAALAGIGAGLTAAAPGIMLDRLVCAPGNAVLVPDGAQPELRALQVELVAGLRRAGLAVREGWRFHPHVTLGYRTREQGSRPIAPIAWRATELVLIDSWVGLTHHETLGRWPLPEQFGLL